MVYVTKHFRIVYASMVGLRSKVDLMAMGFRPDHYIGISCQNDHRHYSIECINSKSAGCQPK